MLQFPPEFPCHQTSNGVYREPPLSRQGTITHVLPPPRLLIYHFGSCFLLVRDALQLSFEWKERKCWANSWKNPAYRRHWISWRVQIVAPIQKKSYVRCHMSHVRWHMSRVTCRMSLTPKAKALDPPPANSPTIHIRMVHKDPQIYFLCGNFRPFLSQNCKFNSLRNLFVIDWFDFGTLQMGVIRRKKKKHLKVVRHMTTHWHRNL